MELRTYLSFPQGVVAFIVLTLSLLPNSITCNWQTNSQLYQKIIARVILAKLRTYLSFFQAMVASLVLIFSHFCCQWHLTTNKRHLAAPKNDEVLKRVKGFQCHNNQSQ